MSSSRPAEQWSALVFQGPAFEPFWDLLGAFADYERWPTLEEYEQQWLEPRCVSARSGVPLTLMAQPPRPRRRTNRSRAELYDVRVNEGRLPTRPCNWHDFFNVMSFAAFPASKLALHARHRRILEERLPTTLQQLPGARTPEQDCLTILDEGGVLLVADQTCSSELEGALQRADQGAILQWIQAGALRHWLLGHAHLELLVRRNLGESWTAVPRAKPVILTLPAEANRAQVDAELARRLADPCFCAGRDGVRAVPLTSLGL
jgi:hypothetical protein